MTEIERLYLALDTCTDDDERESIEAAIETYLEESWEWLRESGAMEP